MKEPASLSARRDLTYDWVRLIATMFVVIGHSTYLDMVTAFGGVSYVLSEAVSPVYFSSGILEFFRKAAAWVYSFHMELFFMLSGAVLAIKPIGSLKKLAVNKARRLLVPYFLWGWLFLFPVLFLADYYLPENLPSAYLGLLTGEESGHLWFLPALYWCMVLMGLAETLRGKLNIPFLFPLLLGFGIAQPLSYRFSLDVLGLAKGLGHIFWFALGYVWEKERQKDPGKNPLKLALAGIAVAAMYFGGKKLPSLSYYSGVLTGSYLTYLVSLVCGRLFRGFAATSLWKVLLRNSFSIYLFHDPLEYVVLKLTFRYDLLNTAAGCYFYCFARIVLVTAASVLIGELVRIGKLKISQLWERKHAL